MRLVVGLENPGAEYAGTRHNIGGVVVTAAADAFDGSFKRARLGIRAVVADVRVEDVPGVLALPGTFMNEAGQAVAPLVRYFGVGGDDLLVVHDDIDLPFAKIRVQYGRGAGGNNGVRSVIGSLGTQDFWRLKIGVGRPPGRKDPADFVLERFRKAERAAIEVSAARSVDVVGEFIRRGGAEARELAGVSHAEGGEPRG
jgi:PTH1 family peptidyl-tRNA hydrolase